MMELNLSGFLEVVNGFEYYDANFVTNPSPDPYTSVGFGVPSSSDFDLLSSKPSIWDPTQDQYSPPSGDDNDSSNTLLKYVNQILMEESIAEKQSMLYDSLALQQTEEMLQQVISDSQDQSYIPSNDSWSSYSNSSLHTDVLYESLGDYPGVQFPGSRMSTENLITSSFSDAESVLQFKKGLEEASKFLPNTDQWIFNPKGGVTTREDKGLYDTSRSRKTHKREEDDLEEETRRSKQFAVTIEDGKLTEMFDKVLLLDGECDPQMIDDENGENGSNKTQEIEGKKGGSRGRKKSQAIDFRTLLTLCAQSVSGGDKISADDLLRQIRKQCSPLGDSSQRLAHFFANALEIRLEGSTSPMIQSYYDSITSKKRTASQILKSYKVFLSASPFMTLIYFFSNKMILDAAKDASVLHIIDFGILYGFQWPMFIQHISKRKGEPLKLRITGIELPQHGFRPTERIEDTGRRLKEYCRRFEVPFEYNAIASKNWETIRIEDLKIRPGEVLAVNSALRFKNLRDVTPDEEKCPRDAFLKLIRDMNPDVFVSSIVNGSFNAPFFTTRFKEALFHYSALFDMFGSTLPRDNPERIHFEGEFYGREVMNVIACEGVDRVERPETYKQWQVRMMRAGFKQKGVETELVESFREKIKRWRYHKDFVVDEDSNWFLQGWKGRILFASSCWVSC